MSWMTVALGRRRRRVPFEDEMTPEQVRAEWMAEWMAEEYGPRPSEEDPPVLFSWRDGAWTRWSQMSHQYEAIDADFVPNTLVEWTATADPPVGEGERLRFVGGEWTRLDPDEPDVPERVGVTEAVDDEPDLSPEPLPPAKPIESKVPATEPDTVADPVADQIAAWRRRIRR